MYVFPEETAPAIAVFAGRVFEVAIGRPIAQARLLPLHAVALQVGPRAVVPERVRYECTTDAHGQFRVNVQPTNYVARVSYNQYRHCGPSRLLRF